MRRGVDAVLFYVVDDAFRNERQGDLHERRQRAAGPEQYKLLLVGQA